jgi:ABC-type Mn2+/Zn2+ transport system permease subunit
VLYPCCVASLNIPIVDDTIHILEFLLGDMSTPRVDLLEALFGDVSKITLADTIITVLVSVCVIMVTRTIYDKIVVSMISKELAIASRIKATTEPT